MPSRLMTIKEALEYAKAYNLKGIKVQGGYLLYTNSVGNQKKVKIKSGMLIYYRGKGRWAIYSPKRDAKIIAHKLTIPVKDKSKWSHYGDLNPEKVVTKSKVVSAKVGKGEGKKKKIKRRIPSGHGEKSL